MENKMKLVNINTLVGKDGLFSKRGCPGNCQHCGLWSEAGCRVILEAPTVDAVEVVHGRWEDGRCSNCQEEALSTSWDEPIYDYDWEENLRYSHTEIHKEYQLTNYCPNCGAKMDGDGNE